MFMSRLKPLQIFPAALLAAAALFMLLAAPAAKADRGNGYCPLNVGFSVNTLPRGHRSVFYGGSRYYTHGGHFYQPYGSGFSVVAAPLGYRLSSLSHGHDSFFYGSYRYSRSHNDYFRWNPSIGTYVTVASPYGSQHRHRGSQIFASAGQSGDQRKQDRAECQQLAASETGYDPQAGGSRAYEYEPIFRGCLEQRGYTVR